MYFFLVKSILGAVVGQSTNAWFKKTKMGIWFYKKVDSWYNWAAKRYDLDILTKEEPDYILLLAWHLSDPIINKWKKKGIKSKSSIPLPNVKIV